MWAVSLVVMLPMCASHVTSNAGGLNSGKPGFIPFVRVNGYMSLAAKMAATAPVNITTIALRAAKRENKHINRCGRTLALYTDCQSVIQW